MSDKYKLDGSDQIAPVPFDAHESVVRSSHEHSETGYQAKDYEHAEYPKAVDHDEKSGAPVIVNNAEEEQAYQASKIKNEIL